MMMMMIIVFFIMMMMYLYGRIPVVWTEEYYHTCSSE